MHCLTTHWQWAVQLVQCNALGAIDSVNSRMHCHTASEQFRVEILLRTATLIEGSGQWNS